MYPHSVYPFPYTYAYVGQYAGRADASRKGAKLLSLYADQGMGKGGTGGYVAAALQESCITKDDILTAWHKGKAAYQAFIDDLAGRSLEKGKDDAPGSRVSET